MLNKYTVTRNGEIVRDRGSYIILAVSATAAIEQAIYLYADKIASNDAYRQMYQYYCELAEDATYSAKQII